MQLTLTTQNARYQRIFFLNNVGEKLRHRRANYKALHTTLGKSNQRFIRPSPPVERWSPQSQPSLIKMSLAINDALNVRQGLCEGWHFSCKGQLVLCTSSGRHGSLLQKEPCRAGSDFSWVLGPPGVLNPPAPEGASQTSSSFLSSSHKTFIQHPVAFCVRLSLPFKTNKAHFCSRS